MQTTTTAKANETTTETQPYDFPLCRQPHAKPLPANKGMTWDEILDACWEHERSMANDR